MENSEVYDKAFADGVDWGTPHIWNEAIEAAALKVEHTWIKKDITDALAGVIRELKKEKQT